MANVLVTQCLNGITIGLIFALVALGLTIVLGLMGVLNFAHGSFYMLGGYITYSVFAAVGNFWLGLVAAMLVCAAAGILLYLTIDAGSGEDRGRRSAEHPPVRADDDPHPPGAQGGQHRHAQSGADESARRWRRCSRWWACR